MTALDLAALNKQWGGYSASAVKGVWWAGAGRVSGEVFGDGRRFGADQRSMLAKTSECGAAGLALARRLGQLSHSFIFQGFSVVRRGVVAWLASHGMARITVFCGLQGLGRLMGHYWTRAASDQLAPPPVAPSARIAEGGRPLSPAPRPLHPRCVRGEQDFKNKTASSGIALGSDATFQSVREVQFSSMGSGVRDVPGAQKLGRESAGFCEIEAEKQGSGKDHIGLRSLKAGEAMKLESAGCHVNQ